MEGMLEMINRSTQTKNVFQGCSILLIVWFTINACLCCLWMVDMKAGNNRCGFSLSETICEVRPMIFLVVVQVRSRSRIPRCVVEPIDSRNDVMSLLLLDRRNEIGSRCRIQCTNCFLNSMVEWSRWSCIKDWCEVSNFFSFPWYWTKLSSLFVVMSQLVGSGSDRVDDIEQVVKLPFGWFVNDVMMEIGFPISCR